MEEILHRDVGQSSQGGNDVGIPGVRPHNLLSSAHPDTLPASPNQGDMIVANLSTPSVWASFPKGTANQFLGLGGLPIKPTWVQPQFSQIVGSASQAQITHGHNISGGVKNVGLSADFTTSSISLVDVTGLTFTLQGRSVNQPLNAILTMTGTIKLSAAGIGYLNLTKDGSAIAAWGFQVNANTANIEQPFTATWNDNAADTILHTYKVQAFVSVNTITLTLNGGTLDANASPFTFFGYDTGMATNIA